MKQKCNALQELRAVLFLMVLLFHCHIPGSQFFWNGVEIFFVISGYFIFQTLLEHKEGSVGKFVKKRIKRLYFPLYLILIILCNLIGMIAMGEFRLHKTLYYFLGVQNYGAFELLLDDNSIMIHTWTVAVELQTILIIGLMTFLYDKVRAKRETMIVALTVISLGYGMASYYLFHNYKMYTESPLAHLVCFAIGGFAYLRTKQGKKLWEDIGMLLVGILGMVYICYRLTDTLSCGMLQALLSMDSSNISLELGPYMILVYPLIGLAGGGIMGLLMRIPNDCCKCKPLICMGDHSYTLYLCHFPIVSILFLFLDNVWVVFGISLVLTLLIGFGYDALYHKKAAA